MLMKECSDIQKDGQDSQESDEEDSGSYYVQPSDSDSNDMIGKLPQQRDAASVI